MLHAPEATRVVAIGREIGLGLCSMRTAAVQRLLRVLKKEKDRSASGKKAATAVVVAADSAPCFGSGQQWPRNETKRATRLPPPRRTEFRQHDQVKTRRRSVQQAIVCCAVGPQNGIERGQAEPSPSPTLRGFGTTPQRVAQDRNGRCSKCHSRHTRQASDTVAEAHHEGLIFRPPR